MGLDFIAYSCALAPAAKKNRHIMIWMPHQPCQCHDRILIPFAILGSSLGGHRNAAEEKNANALLTGHEL